MSSKLTSVVPGVLNNNPIQLYSISVPFLTEFTLIPEWHNKNSALNLIDNAIKNAQDPLVKTFFEQVKTGMELNMK